MRGQSVGFAAPSKVNFGHKTCAIKKEVLKWWQDPDLNRGHKDFQSSALPTELSCQARTENGIKVSVQRQAGIPPSNFRNQKN
jgi:hypothetical protein